MNQGLIPQRYAKALYKVCLDKKSTAEMYAEMKALSAAFAMDSRLQKTLSNPFVSRKDKAKLLETAIGSGASEQYKGLVRILLDNGREEFARDTALAFQKMYRERNHISLVHITTAGNLPDSEMERLRALVRRAFPRRRLEVTESVDQDLIGGFVVDVDSVRMDASLSNELQQLRQTLLSKK